MSNHSDIIILGAGGAGIIAAWHAALLGAQVVVLERNQKTGVKLRISGGGRCNITHGGSMEALRIAFRPREARFLKHSFFRWTNTDVVSLLEQRGIQTVERPNGRVFPAHGFADDVTDALVAAARDAGAEFRTGCKVTTLATSTGGGFSLTTGCGDWTANAVIIATGGVSYQKTGTTGDGMRWAASFGHTILPPAAALAPIAVEPKLPAGWRGISLRGGSIAIWSGGKKIYSWADDLMFSHEGLTGPAVLEISRTAAEVCSRGPAELFFDFFPQKDFDELDRHLSEEVEGHRGKTVGNVLDMLLPNRLVPTFLVEAGIPPDTRGYVLTREQRRTLVRLLKHWPLGSVAQIPIDRGEVSAGGVSLDEVEPRTMASRLVPGLFFCGEVLDIAGPVGGYNLQAAFSTGFVAGESAASQQRA